MRATVVDQELAKQIRGNSKSDVKVEVAMKLYGQGMKLLTDEDATDVVTKDGDFDAMFRQEVSILSSLQGHSSIVTMYGFVEADVNSIVMRVY